MSITTENVVRTMWASLVQTCAFAGVPLTIYEQSTYNERLNILPDAKILDNERPIFGWWCIGDKGHRMGLDSKTDNSFIDPLKHTRKDACNFEPIPFVMRQEGNDLTEKERESYGLRRMEEHDGIKYFAYYAKRVDLSKARAKIIIKTLENGTVIDEEEFKPDTSVIFPKPTVVPPDQGVITNTQIAEIRIPVTIDFNEQDVIELENVAMVRYKNPKLAIISEVGMVTGIKRSTNIVSNGGQQFKFDEVIHAQTAAYISTYQQMSFNRLGFLLELEIGSTEPLETGIIDPIRMAQFRDAGFSATATIRTRE